MQYNLISADGHVDLRFMPGDVFTSRASTKWKDQVPQIVRTAEGPRWYAEGRDILQRPFGNMANIALPKRGVSQHVDRMYEAGFNDGLEVLNEGAPHPTTPALRLKDLDLDGIDAEVIYGVLGMHRVLGSHELLTEVYKLYNDYVAELCRASPQRLAALACIPNDDPQNAADEVRRAAKLGLKGSDFVAAKAVKAVTQSAVVAQSKRAMGHLLSRAIART